MADPVLWRDVTAVGSPFVRVEGDVVRLWFDAFGRESASAVSLDQVVPVPPNDSIGYATARLGAPTAFVTWPFDPVFDRVRDFLDHRSERGPAVVQVPGQEVWLLYFTGFAADGGEAEGLRVARNPGPE